MDAKLLVIGSRYSLINLGYIYIHIIKFLSYTPEDDLFTYKKLIMPMNMVLTGF